MELEPPGAAFFLVWSRSLPNLVGALAGVGSGTSDFRSRSRPEKWRLRNTALKYVAEKLLFIDGSVAVEKFCWLNFL